MSKRKAAAKARFKVYPSAYAMYASAVCGKVTPGGKKESQEKGYGWFKISQPHKKAVSGNRRQKAELLLLQDVER